MTSKTKAELKQYTISRTKATIMSLKDMHNRILNLRHLFRDDKTQKPIFFDLPVCMQALCLDVIYNRGIAGFTREYKKFQAAIKRRDFPTAVKESKIYVNAAKRVVNTYRERRKQRFLRILNIVRENKDTSILVIQKKLSQDYVANVPVLVRLLNGTEDMRSEQALAHGEMEHMRLQKERTQKVAVERAKTNAMRALSQKRGI